MQRNENGQGSRLTPLALVPEETPREHIANARQMVRSFVFLNDAERAGQEGLDLLYAIGRRLATVAGQLETEVERQRLHPEEKVKL